MLPVDLTPLLRLPEITVRSYRDGDFDAAYEVIRSIGPKQLGSNLRAWDKVFMELSSFMWVAEIAGAPVAFAGLSLPSDGSVYLHTDLVTPEYQGRGIGTLLVLTRFAALVDDELDGIDVLVSELSASFYARFGFKQQGPQQLDPFGGKYLHPMSMPYTRELGQSAGAVIESLTRVNFDTSPDEDPLMKEQESP